MMNIVRTFSMGPVRAWLLALALAVSAVGCGNAEFDQVRTYKDFLNQAKPSLQGMNKVREELFNADSVDTMLIKFEAGLLPNIQQLHDLVDKEQVPAGRLGEIHTGLKAAMDEYLASTKKLVEDLKAAKQKNNDDGLERAILDWGAKDKVFGDKMTVLVDDLNTYLDKLVKS